MIRKFVLWLNKIGLVKTVLWGSTVRFQLWLLLGNLCFPLRFLFLCLDQIQRINWQRMLRSDGNHNGRTRLRPWHLCYDQTPGDSESLQPAVIICKVTLTEYSHDWSSSAKLSGTWLLICIQSLLYTTSMHSNSSVNALQCVGACVYIYKFDAELQGGWILACPWNDIGGNEEKESIPKIILEQGRVQSVYFTYRAHPFVLQLKVMHEGECFFFLSFCKRAASCTRLPVFPASAPRQLFLVAKAS